MQLCMWHIHLVLQLRRPNLLKHRAPSFSSLRSQTQLPKPVGTRMEHRSTHKTTANQTLPNRLCPSLQEAYPVRRGLAVREKTKCSLMWTKKVLFHLFHICWGIFQKTIPYYSKAMSSLFVFLALSVQHISVTLVTTVVQYLMSLTKALWTQKVKHLIRIIHCNPVHTCH